MGALLYGLLEQTLEELDEHFFVVRERALDDGRFILDDDLDLVDQAL